LKARIATLTCFVPMLLCLSACAGGPGGGTKGTAPSITVQPSNQTVAAPATATFTVAATGTAPLTYSWQSAPSGSANFTAIAGAANSASYTTPATSTGQSGTQYRVVVSNGVGAPATSGIATLTVNGASVAPSITTQPTNQTVTAPATATFTVVATGTAPLTYTWQSAASGSNTLTAIAGAANSASYTTPATTTGQSGTQYRVVVSNGVNPSATSSIATLTVNAADVAPSITMQPTNQTVTAGQTATFTVTASGTAPLSYQWQSAPSGSSTFMNVGSASATSSLNVANTTVAMSGSSYRVVVSNGINPAATSNSVTLTVNPVNASNVTVLTFHNDVARTAQNLNETILTTTNVNASQFGLVGTITVDGLVDAEPLYVGGMTINGATHNVVFIATENDSVYAFDADTFTQLWQNQLLSSTNPAETPSDNRGCDQVVPIIGVTSTPVIDLSAGPNGTIFVVAMSKNGTVYHQRIHALDLKTGADRMTPTDIQATFSGTGTGSSGGVQTFNPGSYEERAALLLLNGTVYTTWTSHCDATPYNSWVIGFSESNLARNTVLDMTANGASAAGHGGEEGGIWMAGAGPAADSTGNIYLLIGNGTFDTTLNGSNFPNMCDFGNSFMKLSTAASNCTGTGLGVADYFTMHNACCDSNSESYQDTDLGSGGVVVLPDLQSGATTFHLAVGAGKDGNLYVVNRDAMGKFNANNDSAIYQELGGALSGGVWSTPAYFNNTVYYGPVDNHLLAFSIANAQLSSNAIASSNTFGYPGTMPSISANGTSNGIVWALDTGSTGTLFAYNASTMAQLFSGTFTATASAKFATPMIANGKVYAGTGPTGAGNGGSVAVFGLLPTSSKVRRANRAVRPSRQNRLPAPVAPHPGSSTPGE
jgi:Immunoglobulin domain